MNESPEVSLTGNLSFVERLYGDFVRDPSSVGPEWKRYFEQLRNGEPFEEPRFKPSFRSPGLFEGANGSVGGSEAARIVTLQNRVNRLVRNYRVRGHNIAAVDPLGLPRPMP